MNSQILAKIRNDLKHSVDPKTSGNFQSFFKEKVTCYGVKTGIVSRIAKDYFEKVKPSGKEGIFLLCEELFKSDYNEEAFIGCEWAYRLRSEYQPGDFAVFENWIGKYINNWAKCDTLCNHAVGSFIEKYPGYINHLKNWTKPENRWFRRAAAVTLIVPAKRGKFLDDIFEIAMSLLTDKDDLVQKGYGWLLKEASRTHQQEVFDFVMKNRRSMPRTALRYAIEKMPEALRLKAMRTV